ncbi:MAG: SDR family NAD(P)-dependent oxidoreductase [Thermodesulfobacteriota bacterium]
MKALVTGAGGFIGSFLVAELIRRGHTVRALLLPQEDAAAAMELGAEIVRGDLTRPETLSGVGKGVDVVFHLAGRVLDWGAYDLFRAVMVEGTRHLLEACGRDIGRFVYFSSIAALGLNRDLAGLDETAGSETTGIPYCDTKIEAEALVKQFCTPRSIPYTIIRPANVIGPGSVWVRDVLDAYYRGPMPLIAGGHAPGAFVFVKNLVEGALLAAEAPQAAGRTYHFRDDYDLTWGDYLRELGSWIGKKPLGSLPFSLAWKLGGFLEFLLSPLNLRPPLTRLAAGVMGCDNEVDCTRAKTELGWETRIPVREAMKEIHEWVDRQYRPVFSGRIQDFRNVTAYITGGSSGIGLETARLLAAQGAHILLIARNLSGIEAACRELQTVRRNDHQRIEGLSADVADSDDVQRKMADAVKRFGPPDILINSAGVIRSDYFENISCADFDRVMKINVYGIRNMVAALLPAMKQRGGRIVIVASAAGLMGMFSYTAYGTSKFAAVGLAECLRAELKRHRIGVTLICPPEVKTAMIEEESKTIPPEARAVKRLAGSLTAVYVAGKIVGAIRRGRFLVVPGKIAALLYLNHSLTLGWATRWSSDLVIRLMNRKKDGKP